MVYCQYYFIYILYNKPHKMSSSKVMTAKVSASIQSGDSASLLKTALFVGVAVLVVILLIFLYKKFFAKKPQHEYFVDANGDVVDANGNPPVVELPAAGSSEDEDEMNSVHAAHNEPPNMEEGGGGHY
jgi:hypothetical protein